MTQGIRVVKAGYDVSTRDPRNVALDTRTVGSLKKLPTLYINAIPANYTETYQVEVFPGDFRPFGRLRISHDFGFPPAFTGFVTVTMTNGIKNGYVLPRSITTFGTVTVESNKTEVIVEGLPITLTSDISKAVVALNIFAENLDAATI